METLPNVQIPFGHEHHGSEPVIVKIVIDLENHCVNNLPHPTNDSGVVIYYLVKVNDQKHETKRSSMIGSEIIALDGKDSDSFLLYQTRRKHGEAYLEPIGKHELVDFTSEGIESLVVKPKTYPFSIGKTGYESTVKHLTVRQILVDYAQADSSTNTLSSKGGHEYKNLDEVIDLECVNQFVLFNDEPTPVS